QDGGDDHGRQRTAVCRGGDQHGRNGDYRGSDADGERGAGSANDHDGAGESDGDGGTDGELRGGGGGNGAAELPVAEERCEHRGGQASQLVGDGDSASNERRDDTRGGQERGG